MADPPGKESDEPLEGESRGPLPDLMRRFLGVGLSGFFFTEETVRKALGDTVPKDWIDFAVEQSERTRAEFLERLSYELGQTLENIDVAAVLKELLEGRTLEVKAEIRLGEKSDREGASVRIVPSSGKG